MSTRNHTSASQSVRSRHASHECIPLGVEGGSLQNPFDPPKNAFWRLWFKALCMIAVSKPSLEHWDDLINDEKRDEWDEHKKMVIERLGNMNVTAGLVLTTTAVFISTNPRKSFLYCRKTTKNLISQFLAFQPLMPYASHGRHPPVAIVLY
ncbi:uncharacterized protein EDB91DRAFT_1250710 [Suillus paluster]|uniref:uncharacterized protein n=1 Tax=Suillus paluster TaxID=48578 RepID=UPI001B867A04|nr:uncharacterized protein EDB91DRAFT_1250710 [Suillus paluster]KAG1734885.1 hypothetical protein EDB91DRAFT_1250710 [Suillus paluster]